MKTEVGSITYEMTVQKFTRLQNGWDITKTTVVEETENLADVEDMVKISKKKLHGLIEKAEKQHKERILLRIRPKSEG